MITRSNAFHFEAMLAIVLLTLGPGASARAHADGAAEIACALPRTIAVLPAVSVNGNAGAEQAAERSWSALRSDADAHWLSADSVRARLAHAAGADASLADRARAAIWRDGAPDAALAAALARVLGVDAVLSVRPDRWELADGGRAMVGATAALSGADGALLWRRTGATGCGAPRTSVERHFTDDLDWIWSPRLEPGDHAERKLDCALVSLLAGWSAALPAPVEAAVDGAPATIETVSGD